MMSPAGGRRGRVAHNLGLILGRRVRRAGLGAVYAAETGFLIARDPDTVPRTRRGFISHPRLQQIGDDAGCVPTAPDLVGEVISPNDHFWCCGGKGGAGLVGGGYPHGAAIDPGTRTVHVYRAADRKVVFDGDCRGQRQRRR